MSYKSDDVRKLRSQQRKFLYTKVFEGDSCRLRDELSQTQSCADCSKGMAVDILFTKYCISMLSVQDKADSTLNREIETLQEAPEDGPRHLLRRRL